MTSPSSPLPAEPTPSVRSASELAVLLSALKDAVTKAYERGRVDAIAEMERAGSTGQLVKAADGVELGTLNQTRGKWVAEVHDEDALLGWVQDNRPDEWYQSAPLLRIQEAFLKWLCADAITRASAGQSPHPVDGVTGSVIPGVRAVWKPGGTTVTANRTAKERAEQFLGQLLNQAQGLTPAAAPEQVDSVPYAHDRSYPDATVVPVLDTWKPAPF